MKRDRSMKHIFMTLFFLNTLVASENVEWQNSHYIWDFGMINSCNKGMNLKPRDYFADEPTFVKEAYQNINAGDIVWVHCRFIPRFCNEILKDLAVPLVLVVSDGDESFPSDCGATFDVDALLSHPSIIKVFAQNSDYKGDSHKVEQIPIGMDFHTIAYKGTSGGWGEKGSPTEQEAVLNAVLSKAKPTHERIKKAFVDFQQADTMRAGFKRYLQFGEDRATIFKRLVPTGLIDHGGWMRRSKLWETKTRYAFSISPHGNGLDCHRTWEDMVLGCIVIVKTSTLDPLYDGLPVVIIKDWSEITSENMDTWLAKYGDAFTNISYREKLTHKYWFNKIQASAASYKQ